MRFRRRKREEIVKAEQAILDATQTLREVRGRDPEVHQISGALRSIREQNHFADHLRIIMGGR